MFGFGYVWLNEGVEEIVEFIRVFRERLILCRWQEWEFHVNNSDRFSVYTTFCTSADVKTYLLLNIDKHLKYVMSRFRLGISEIAEHYYRYRKHNQSDLLCQLCKKEKENEMHFVLCCHVLQDLRVRYIPSKCYNFPSMFKLALLLASTHEQTIKNVAIYLYKAFKLRSVLIS
jgi:hypothetical protein